jgi:two-component system cell cycle sensor histidine kinase PleC
MLNMADNLKSIDMDLADRTAIPARIIRTEPERGPSAYTMTAHDLIERAPTCGLHSTGSEVLELFQQHPGVPLIPVLDRDGAILGALERDRLLQTCTQPLWYDVYNRRPVWPLMNANPLIVDDSVSLDDIKQLIVSDYPTAIQAGFLIASQSSFAGIGTMGKLLELTVTQAQRRLVELDDARRAAEDAAAARSRFLATMSHELRTPLNAIIGFSDLLLMQIHQGAPITKLPDYLSDIGSSGKHLLQVINDILDYSKLETGAMSLDEGVFSMQSLMSASIRIARGQSEAKGVALELAPCGPDINHGDINFCGDERKLRQVLLNLLSNAIKFTPSGGHIELCMRCDLAGAPIVTVTDNGRGIAKDDLARVFEPFVQVDGEFDRTSGGTGLGLPLSRLLVELHGGKLSLESILGQGTTAIVSLPRERIDAGDASIRRPASTGPAAAPG